MSKLSVFIVLISLSFISSAYALSDCQEYCAAYSARTKGLCMAGCNLGCINPDEAQNLNACQQVENNFLDTSGDEAPWLEQELPGEGDFCGGIADIPCDEGLKCVDNPNDDCDPALGGADCSGYCVKANSCVDQETVYTPGDSFPASDGCNTCVCGDNGQIACTKIACPVSCTYNGISYLVGDSFPKGDECNECTCQDGGQVGCTEIFCP